jgi:hypothetical protein
MIAELSKKSVRVRKFIEICRTFQIEVDCFRDLLDDHPGNRRFAHLPGP